MRVTSLFVRGLVGAFALTSTLGCRDQLPTATGEERFPGGRLPTTVEVVLPAEDFLVSESVYSGFADPQQAPFLMIANRFGGELQAHVLARLTGFPDSVTFAHDGGSVTDTAFAYGAGRVITTVNADRSTSVGPARLRLWALEQAWDTAGVSWTVAARRDGNPVPWRVPGGTRGTLLAETTWVPGDTVARDSVVWRVDSLTVGRMARPDFAGLLVTTETSTARVQISRLVLQTAVRPATRPDTAIARTISGGPQKFIFTPEPPVPDGVYRVGGITGERTVLQLDLSRTVPGCASPATTPNCPGIQLRDVTINQASLLLTPRPVTSGFRPLGLTYVQVRKVVEPELGRRAPLAELLTVDSVPASRFVSPTGEPVAIDMSRAVARFASADSARATLALLADREGEQFGYLWFAARPQLRIVYTLPLRPSLP